jgi:hypothetical protein
VIEGNGSDRPLLARLILANSALAANRGTENKEVDSSTDSQSIDLYRCSSYRLPVSGLSSTVGSLATPLPGRMPDNSSRKSLTARGPSVLHQQVYLQNVERTRQRPAHDHYHYVQV